MINSNNYDQLPALLNTVNNGKWILADVKLIIMLIFIAASAWVIADISKCIFSCLYKIRCGFQAAFEVSGY